MPKRTLVIFANSMKHQQHCVAGKCLVTKEWIRPVADPNGRELTHDQVMYQNKYGTYSLKTLQNIEMNLTERVALPNQPENYLVDETVWQQRYSTKPEEIGLFLDTPISLWGEGDRVNYQGILDKNIIIDQSLYLIQAQDLNLYNNENGRRRASFSYNELVYNLAVTDPKFDQIKQNSEEVMGILCVSLGEPFHGNCFKLVAAIY